MMKNIKPTHHNSKYGIALYQGNCLDVLPTLAAESVDSIVTDPPYGLRFMGKKWDCQVPGVDIWQECLRVLKPGGHLLCFAGTRTHHRIVVNIEDAGFEIRDMIAWVYGQGFPKSLDVSKAIDKAAGAKREIVGDKLDRPGYHLCEGHGNGTYGGGKGLHAPGTNARQSEASITAPATDAAKQWDGWGTALKPAFEPITVARKPLIGTVAENVLKYGTGVINVDGCRVEILDTDDIHAKNPHTKGTIGSQGIYGPGKATLYSISKGRFPANFIHDGSDEVVKLMPETGGDTPARFFYCAKASKKDRDEGCEEPGNNHPTVKPTALMRYLCRLVTQPGGLVLDPFMGSGSAGKAAVMEGFRFTGIEKEWAYVDIAKTRIQYAIRIIRKTLWDTSDSKGN